MTDFHALSIDLVARHLLGEPNQKLSSRRELRYGNRSVPLGTLEVRDYLGDAGRSPPADIDLVRLSERFPTEGPRHRYGAIMFIEKEGFAPLFAAAQIADRYDIALMSTKGVPTTASRFLLDELCPDHDIPVFVLHDFDAKGFEILSTLQRATRRYQFKNSVQVIDLGIRLADIETYELPSEKVSYRESDPAKNLIANGATSVEIDFLVHRRVGKKWAGRRVELNAFTSRQFIEWIESKLNEHGISKVVPDNDVLEAAYRRAVGADYLREHSAELIESARHHSSEAPIPPELRRELIRRIKRSPAISWDLVVRDLARK